MKRYFLTVILGFVFGHLVVRLSLDLGLSSHSGLHNAVWRAEKTIDEKFGKDSFLYGVRRMGRVENHEGKSKMEAYIFDVDINTEVGTERWNVLVDLSRKHPEVFMGNNERRAGTR